MEYYCISRTWDGLHEALNEYGSQGWTVLSIFFDYKAIYKVVLQRAAKKQIAKRLEWGDFVELNDTDSLETFVDLMGTQIKESVPKLKKFDYTNPFILEWKIRQ